MTYTIRRIRVKSAAKVAFFCLLIAMLPLLPALVIVFTMPSVGFGEPPPGVNVASLISALAVPLLYGAFAAIGAGLLAFVYNLSVRFHGGLKFDIELHEDLAEEKKKN